MYLDFQNEKGEGLVDWNSKGIGAGGGGRGVKIWTSRRELQFCNSSPS